LGSLVLGLFCHSSNKQANIQQQSSVNTNLPTTPIHRNGSRNDLHFQRQCLRQCLWGFWFAIGHEGPSFVERGPNSGHGWDVPDHRSGVTVTPTTTHLSFKIIIWQKKTWLSISITPLRDELHNKSTKSPTLQYNIYTCNSGLPKATHRPDGLWNERQKHRYFQPMYSGTKKKKKSTTKKTISQHVANKSRWNVILRKSYRGDIFN